MIMNSKMIKLILCSIPFLFFGCKNVSSSSSSSSSSSCGYYTFSNGSTTPTYVGPNGGCYYINSNGNQQYVGHEYCCN